MSEQNNQTNLLTVAFVNPKNREERLHAVKHVVDLEPDLEQHVQNEDGTSFELTGANGSRVTTLICEDGRHMWTATRRILRVSPYPPEEVAMEVLRLENEELLQLTRIQAKERYERALKKLIVKGVFLFMLLIAIALILTK